MEGAAKDGTDQRTNTKQESRVTSPFLLYLLDKLLSLLLLLLFIHNL